MNGESELVQRIHEEGPWPAPWYDVDQNETRVVMAAQYAEPETLKELTEAVPDIPSPFVTKVVEERDIDVKKGHGWSIKHSWDEFSDKQKEALLLWSQYPNISGEEMDEALSETTRSSAIDCINRYGWVFSDDDYGAPILPSETIEVYWNVEATQSYRMIRERGTENRGVNRGISLDDLVEKLREREAAERSLTESEVLRDAEDPDEEETAHESTEEREMAIPGLPGVKMGEAEVEELTDEEVDEELAVGPEVALDEISHEVREDTIWDVADWLKENGRSDAALDLLTALREGEI